MKGQIIASHALALGLIILLVIGTVLVFNSFRTQQSVQLAEAQLKSICFRIKSAAEAMWSSTNYQTNATMGRIILSLPVRAGGSSYSVTGQGERIELSSPDLAVSAACHISVAQIFGTSSGGVTELLWTRTDTQDIIELR